MVKIKVTSCPIEGLKMIVPRVVEDKRGYFSEAIDRNELFEMMILSV